MAKKNELKFFEELYLPPLAKAGNKSAQGKLRIARATQANKAMRAAGVVFGKMFTKEDAKEYGRKGGTQRWAKLDPEEARKQKLAGAARMRAHLAALPKAERSARQSHASKSMWRNLSPEERERRLALARLNLEKGYAKRMARWEPKWPFPFGPGRMTGKQLSAAKAKKALRRKGFKIERD